VVLVRLAITVVVLLLAAALGVIVLGGIALGFGTPLMWRARDQLERDLRDSPRKRDGSSSS